MNHDLEDRIRVRAYHLWEQDGRPAGKGLEHWLAATHQIANETAAIAGTADDDNTATQALPAAGDAPAVLTDGVAAAQAKARKPRTAKVVNIAAVAAKPGRASKRKPEAGASRH